MKCSFFLFAFTAIGVSWLNLFIPHELLSPRVYGFSSATLKAAEGHGHALWSLHGPPCLGHVLRNVVQFQIMMSEDLATHSEMFSLEPKIKTFTSDEVASNSFWNKASY